MSKPKIGPEVQGRTIFQGKMIDFWTKIYPCVDTRCNNQAFVVKSLFSNYHLRFATAK